MMFNDNTLFYSILSSNILIFRIVFALSLTMKGSLLCHAIPCDTLQVQVSCQPLRPHCTQACAQDVQSPRHPSPHLPQGTWLGSQITPVNQLSPVTVVFCFNEDPNQFFFSSQFSRKWFVRSVSSLDGSRSVTLCCYNCKAKDLVLGTSA